MYVRRAEKRVREKVNEEKKSVLNNRKNTDKRKSSDVGLNLQNSSEEEERKKSDNMV